MSHACVTHYKAHDLDYDTTKFALEHCCDPRFVNKDESTPLDVAIYSILRGDVKWSLIDQQNLDPHDYNINFDNYQKYDPMMNNDYKSYSEKKLRKRLLLFQEYKILRLLRTYIIYHNIKNAE